MTHPSIPAGPIGDAARALLIAVNPGIEHAPTTHINPEGYLQLARAIVAFLRYNEGDPRPLLAMFSPMTRPGDNPTPPQPPSEHIMQFFVYEQLDVPISTFFATLAHEIVATLPRNPERTVALRKLLEAKDAAVRAKLAK